MPQNLLLTPLSVIIDHSYVFISVSTLFAKLSNSALLCFCTIVPRISSKLLFGKTLFDKATIVMSSLDSEKTLYHLSY